MLKTRLSFLKSAIVALVAMLCVAQASEAQVGVFVGGGGRYGGTQWGVSVGTPFYGGAYYGSAYRYGGIPYYGYNSYPYYSNAYYSPLIYPSNYLLPTRYNTSVPYYSNAYAPNSIYTVPYSSYPVYYAGDSGNGANGDQAWNSASIQVILPAGATLTFDGTATQQTGPVRYFTTPALPDGRTSSYQIEATWKDANGADVTRTRTILVAPNQQTTVNLMQPEPAATNSNNAATPSPGAVAPASGAVPPIGGANTAPSGGANPPSGGQGGFQLPKGNSK